MESNSFFEFELQPEVVLPNDNDILVEQFYITKYYLSPSALNKFLWRPRAWYEYYVLNKKEDRKETKALIEGSLIHLLMLQPKEFNDKYVISQEDLVKDTQKKVLDKAFYYIQSLEPVEIMPLEWNLEVLLDKMAECDYYQNLADEKPTKSKPDIITGDAKRLQKIITPAAERYWNFLKEKTGKTMISQETYDYCVKAASLISNDKRLRDCLGLDAKSNVEVYNEIELKVELDSYMYGLKGIIDNLVIDHNSKVIRINDIKTTQKALNEFAESIAYYGYDNQIMIYSCIVALKYSELCSKGYVIECNFVVVNSMGDTYLFPVSEETQNYWLGKLINNLKEFEWCLTNRNFTNFKKYVLNEYVL